MACQIIHHGLSFVQIIKHERAVPDPCVMLAALMLVMLPILPQSLTPYPLYPPYPPLCTIFNLLYAPFLGLCAFLCLFSPIHHPLSPMSMVACCSLTRIPTF